MVLLFERFQLSDNLSIPHLQKFLVIGFQPFTHQILCLDREIAVRHLEGMDVKDSYILIVNGMNMGGLVFFGFEEHFDDDSVKSTNLWHTVYRPLHIRCRNNGKGNTFSENWDYYCPLKVCVAANISATFL